MAGTGVAGARRPGILGQLVRFGAVGAVGVGVNLVVFNALRLTVLAPDVLATGPLLASALATLAAIAANWVGNRYWAFGAERRADTAREALEFFGVSLAGMLVPIACLGVSHYALGLTSLLADNVATNVVGLALGAAFRFALYRWWVFAPGRRRTDPPGPASPTGEDTAVLAETRGEAG